MRTNLLKFFSLSALSIFIVLILFIVLAIVGKVSIGTLQEAIFSKEIQLVGTGGAVKKALSQALVLNGILMTNSDPFPFSLVKLISPLCSCIIFLVVIRPNPVPFIPLLVIKSLKIDALMVSLMPQPLSRTL